MSKQKLPHVKVGDSVVFVTPDGEQLPAIVTAVEDRSVVDVKVKAPLDSIFHFYLYELSHYDAEGKEPCSWHVAK